LKGNRAGAAGVEAGAGAGAFQGSTIPALHDLNSRCFMAAAGDNPCRDYLICPQKCVEEGHYFGCGLLHITAQSQ